MITGFNNQVINKGRQKLLDAAQRYGFDDCMIQILRETEGTLKDLKIVSDYIYANRKNYTGQQLYQEIKRCVKLCADVSHQERLSWVLPFKNDTIFGSNKKGQIVIIPETYNIDLNAVHYGYDDTHIDDLYAFCFLKKLYQCSELNQFDIEILWGVYSDTDLSFRKINCWSNDSIPESFLHDFKENKEKSFLYSVFSKQLYVSCDDWNFLQREISDECFKNGQLSKLEECFDIEKFVTESDMYYGLDKNKVYQILCNLESVNWMREIYGITEKNNAERQSEFEVEKYEQVKMIFPDTYAFFCLNENIEKMEIAINGKYINCTCRNYNKIAITKDGKINPYGDDIHLCFVICPDFSLYMKTNNKMIPLQCKTIQFWMEKNKFFKEFMVQYLEKMSTNFPIAKDILKELSDDIRWLLPISLFELLYFHNKGELFRKKYKIAKELKINYNKLSFSLAYMIINAYPYVDEKSRGILMNIKDESLLSDIHGRNFKDKVKYFLYNYYTVKLGENEFIILDYLNMSFQLKEKISLRYKSLKKITDRHNELVNEIMGKEFKKDPLKVPKDSIFNELRKILPSEFEWIKTKSRLYHEGKIQNHCVYSYGKRITKDSCAIYSYLDTTGEYTKIWKGKPIRYTIEFRYRKGKYIINQIQGYGNTVDTSIMKKFVSSLLVK